MGTQLMQAIPRIDAETAAALDDIVTSVAQQHPEVRAAILFGSVARHEERPLDDPQPSDVDLLLLIDPSVLDVAATRLTHTQELALTNTIGEADYRHRSPREIQTLFVYRDLAGWDATFIENVARDGILLWSRDALPSQFAAITAREPHGTLASSGA